LNTAPSELDWNEQAIEELLTFLEDNNTRAFIVLKNGKMVIEEYFGQNITDNAPFDRDSPWYWASAGKALTATLVGIAQEEGLLDIERPSSAYLGAGWTSLPTEEEDLITVRHQLTMTTGLSYDVTNLDCTLPACLVAGTAPPGEQWYYHNAPYTLLEDVVANASGLSYNDFTTQKIASLIGMNGRWIKPEFNNVYWSTARDMARFGLLILNRGKWAETEVLKDHDYYEEMINTSQDLNQSYGYLWWLNGKASIIYPGLAASFNVPLSPNAPVDLFAGLGRNGQFVEVIPSEGLVVIRMGEAPDNALVPIAFHDEMWEKINAVMD
jgi:CubicO group peptidase (beta-lactamase class C family)